MGIDIDPILVERANEKNKTDNIQFYCMDFMDDNSLILIKDYLKKRKLSKFDAVFCFSITMWIHLNYGDDGLKRFLKEICNLGELIIIEPQPWKCYKSAVKRMKLSNSVFPLFKELQITQGVENEIDQFILENCKAVKLYESKRSEWGRKVIVFKCSPISS